MSSCTQQQRFGTPSLPQRMLIVVVLSGRQITVTVLNTDLKAVIGQTTDGDIFHQDSLGKTPYAINEADIFLIIEIASVKPCILTQRILCKDLFSHFGAGKYCIDDTFLNNFSRYAPQCLLKITAAGKTVYYRAQYTQAQQFSQCGLMLKHSRELAKITKITAVTETVNINSGHGEIRLL